MKAHASVGVFGGKYPTSNTVQSNSVFDRTASVSYTHLRIPLSINGIGIGSLGVAEVDLVGTAYNLPRPGLIAGTYAAAGAGATFVGGGQVARLQNQNGVVLEVQGVQLGFQVSIGLGGMTIALQ